MFCACLEDNMYCVTDRQTNGGTDGRTDIGKVRNREH